MPVAAEPRVITDDVKRALNLAGITADKQNKGSVDRIARRVGVTPRTIYRVLECKTDTIKLDLADRIMVALGRHVSECRLLFREEIRG